MKSIKFNIFKDDMCLVSCSVLWSKLKTSFNFPLKKIRRKWMENVILEDLERGDLCSRRQAGSLSLSLPWKSCGELTHTKITCASLCFVVLQPVALCHSAQRCLSKTPKRANWFGWCAYWSARQMRGAYKSAREALFGITTALTIQWVVFFANSKHIKMNKFLVSDPLTNIND